MRDDWSGVIHHVELCPSAPQSQDHETNLLRANYYSYNVFLNRGTGTATTCSRVLSEIHSWRHFSLTRHFLHNLWKRHIHNYSTVRCCTRRHHKLDDLFQILRQWHIDNPRCALRGKIWTPCTRLPRPLHRGALFHRSNMHHLDDLLQNLRHRPLDDLFDYTFRDALLEG